MRKKISAQAARESVKRGKMSVQVRRSRNAPSALRDATPTPGQHARRPAPYTTPSFFCRLVDEVVYWNTRRLSG